MTGIYLSDQPRQPWRRCPYCLALHDGMTGASSRPGVVPRDGVFLICADCGNWGVLDSVAEGGWRKPTEAEDREAMDDYHFCMVLAASRVVTERRRG